MRVVLLGPPGAGKGTQAHVLADHHAIPHISTGDLLRANLRDETPVGLEAREYMDAGNLVPDDVVLRMVAERLDDQDPDDGFMFDGFPRTIDQATALEKVLADAGTPLDVVVNIAVDREQIVARLTGRRSCPDGHVYHVVANPPEQEGICDVDGKPLFQRDDDTEEVVRNRLEVYDEQTAPLVDFYDDRGLLETVDGAGEVEEVTTRIEAVLDAA